MAYKRGGNRGLIVSGKDIMFVHPNALSAKPSIDKAVHRLNKEIAGIEGAWIEEGDILQAPISAQFTKKIFDL